MTAYRKILPLAFAICFCNQLFAVIKLLVTPSWPGTFVVHIEYKQLYLQSSWNPSERKYCFSDRMRGAKVRHAEIEEDINW